MHLPNWNDTTDYRHHQGMKAVLLNSADKIHQQSDLPASFSGITTLPVPDGGFLDQDRTVLRKDGGNWFSTPAADKSSASGGLQPLDDQFGAGELDTKRALTQLTGGEYHSFQSGGPDFVPTIGWDYGHSSNINQTNSYYFNQQLRKGSFIAVSLAFDRSVTFLNDQNSNGKYDAGDTFNPTTNIQSPGADQISDLDLYLYDITQNQIEAVSRNGDGTIEHIFWQIQNDDNYEIYVKQGSDNGGPVDYGLAWWALGTGPSLGSTLPGDVNQDGHVDAKDIKAMMQALTNEFAYANSIGISTDELSLFGDVNGDGVFNNADLQALLNLLKNGGGSTSVPEPASYMLLAMGGLFLLQRCVSQRVTRKRQMV